MRRPTKAKPQEIQAPQAEGLLILALTHVDALLERIRFRKIKTFEQSLLDPIRKLSQKEIKVLNHQYARSYEDIKAALSGDEFFIEAYSNFDKAQMKLVITLYKALKTLKHDDAAIGRRFGNHAPRKKKQRPPEQVVKKVLFLEKDKETGVSSLNPTQLVGAKEMWVYNVKTRKLGCYYAKGDDGLSAKGTTILNYNEKLSTTKTIRKPKAQIHDFISKSPTEMHRYWDAIRAVPQEITPRMSRDTVILRTLDSSSSF